jgi:hypothetical protein
MWTLPFPNPADLLCSPPCRATPAHPHPHPSNPSAILDEPNTRGLSHPLLASLDLVCFSTLSFMYCFPGSCIVPWVMHCFLGHALFPGSCSAIQLKARKLFARPSPRMAAADRANRSPVNLAKRSSGLGPPTLLLSVPRPT